MGDTRGWYELWISLMAHLALNNEILNDFNKLGIAFSGGIDSSRPS